MNEANRWKRAMDPEKEPSQMEWGSEAKDHGGALRESWKTTQDTAKRVGLPILRQSWRNMCVWFPLLTRRVDRQRQVAFWAREYRHHLTWNIPFPEECWECAAKKDLQRQKQSHTVRSFDNPIVVVVVTATFLLTFALLGIIFFWWWTLVAMFLFLALAAGVMLLKSWQEEVRITIWACPQHAPSTPSCEVVCDQDQLFLYVPNSRVAENMVNEQKQERQKKVAARESATSESREPAPRAASSGAAPPKPPASGSPRKARPEQVIEEEPRGEYVPRFQPPPRKELPPLKLADDDELPPRKA